jgi:hypothetical protein
MKNLFFLLFVYILIAQNDCKSQKLLKIIYHEPFYLGIEHESHFAKNYTGKFGLNIFFLKDNFHQKHKYYNFFNASMGYARTHFTQLNAAYFGFGHQFYKYNNTTRRQPFYRYFGTNTEITSIISKNGLEGSLKIGISFLSALSVNYELQTLNSKFQNGVSVKLVVNPAFLVHFFNAQKIY